MQDEINDLQNAVENLNLGSSGAATSSFTVPSRAQKYDDASDALTAQFQDVDLTSLREIKFSENSYGTGACQWIAENVLEKAVNLEKVDFSDMFTARLRSDLPISLEILMGKLDVNKIVDLNLSHNAFGPDGVKSFQKFLREAKNLKVLNVTNCGLGPIGSSMIAESILENDEMKLTEFYACRDRLEDPGMEAMAKVFTKHQTLQKVEVYQNGSKSGLAPLLGSLASSCSESLRELHIQDNKGVNQAVPQLVELLEKCKNLEILNISDLKMKKSKAIIVKEALIKTLQNGSSLKELLWNYDLACSQTTAKSVAEEISRIENSKLEKLEMVGTFQLQENRQSVKELFANSSVQVTLFKPDYTDDESEDHDASEEESAEEQQSAEEEAENDQIKE